MRSPALALSWQVWWPQRWLWAGLAVYVPLLALAGHLLPAGEPARLAVQLGLLPLTLVIPVVVGALACAPGADLMARNSAFPAWMFTLPVRTRALVGWQMLNGTVAVLALGAAVTFLVLRPGGFAVSAWMVLIVPAMLGWLQALVWAPFTYPFLRMPLTVVLLAAHGPGMVALAGLGVVPPSAAAGLLVGSTAVAYGVAFTGVRRARRGVGLECRRTPWGADGLLDAVSRRFRFASPAGAQVWYELRRQGYVFPWTVGWLLATYLPVCLIDVDPRWLLAVVAYPAAFPVLMSHFMGPMLGKGDAVTKDSALPPFLAVRPLSTAAFVRAKLVTTAWAALAACLLGWLAASVVLFACGELATARAQWQEGPGGALPAQAAWALLLSAPVLLFLLTWKNLANGLWIGLTGRAWVGHLMGGMGVGLLIALGGAGAWLYHHPRHRGLAWDLLPWLVGAVLLARAALSALIVRTLSRRRLLTRGQLAWGVGLWLFVTCCLIGLAWWLLPAEMRSPFWCVCACVYLVPFNGIALAPLALDWNRHR